MSTSTSIEWTDKTWNPTRGCSRVSPGCENCYAERVAVRFAADGRPYAGLVRSTKKGPRWTGKVKLIPDLLHEPLRWKKPCRIFVNSMSDLFHERLTDEEIFRVFDVMSHAGWKHGHTFQVLTKRPERMLDFMRKVPGELAKSGSMKIPWPPPTVHLGVSVENQETADERIPLLLQVPAAVRFLSVEPLLGTVDLMRRYLRLEPRLAKRLPGIPDDNPGVDWVIAGGESGPGARPCDVAWIRSIVSQCKATGVPCFVKQLGARAKAQDGVDYKWIEAQIGDSMGRPLAGRVREIAKESCAIGPDGFLYLRDRKGGDPAEWPSDLRVREFPEVRE